MTEHSIIGPSALYRIIACPGSVKLSMTVPRGTTSIHAATGSVGHTIFEQTILQEDLLFETPPELGDVVQQDGYSVEVTQEMLDGVQHMIDHCQDLKGQADKTWVEERVDLGFLWNGSPPDPIFGTVDFGAYLKPIDTLHVVDLKMGRLDVNPFENPQASAYGVGMINELGFVPANVVLTIVQPYSMGGGSIVKSYHVTGLDLMIWADTVMVPAVDEAYSDNPRLVAGEHCRFCPAKHVCPALSALAQDKAKADFSHLPVDPNSLSDAEIGDVMDWVAVLKMWIESVQAEVSQRIERGGAVPNWKLVDKRAVRKWASPVQIEKRLMDTPEAWDRKVKTPTQLEKVDPDLYRDLETEGHVSKKSSGTTLAPDNDPRDAVAAKQAKDDFSAVG